MSKHLQLPRVTLAQAALRPQLDFVLPSLLAGSIGMIVGQGTIGKSFLALHIGLAIGNLADQSLGASGRLKKCWSEMHEGQVYGGDSRCANNH